MKEKQDIRPVENKGHTESSRHERLMKAMKAVNIIAGRSVDPADLKSHRKTVERAGRLAALKDNIRIEQFTVDEIPCEAVRPELAYNPQYAIIYAHGGGFISGGLYYARVLATKMAVSTGFATYTFAYRLAPEHPYPAALTDAMAVWDRICDSYRPDHIILAGDSAGGNLALCMVQTLLAKKRPIPGMLLLFSPWTDMTCNSESYIQNKELDPILTKEYVTDAARAYTAGAGEPSDARFSPLFGELAGFPPTYIMAGRNEILLDDSIRLRDGIVRAGGKAQLDIEKAGWHVYQQMPIPIAKRAMKRLAAYVSAEIYGV